MAHGASPLIPISIAVISKAFLSDSLEQPFQGYHKCEGNFDMIVLKIIGDRNFQYRAISTILYGHDEIPTEHVIKVSLYWPPRLV